jgi:N-acetylmuramic acid 6-phosphate etherase
MVEMQATNVKLRRRALRMLARIGGRDEDAARSALDASGGDLKVAILVLLDAVSPDAARQRLAATGGRVRAARGGA